MLRPLATLLLSVVLLAAPSESQEAERTGADVLNADRFVAVNSGRSTFSVPIPAPIGTGGSTPSFQLRYTGTTSDGPFGVGWSLALGEIRRSSRFGVPSFDASDRFELNGELLVEDPANPDQFRTATETFSRITYDSTADGWTVEFPDGRVARFGTHPESQIRLDGSTTPENDLGAVVVWLTSELQDAHGNVIQILYDRSIDVGTAYPESIVYAYRNGSLVGGVERRIDFFLEARPDRLHSFRGGLESVLTRRVSEIRSTIDAQPFRRLILTYSTDLAYTVHRSRIAATQLFGTDCPPSQADPLLNCSGLPPQTYVYTDPALDLGEPGVAVSTNWSTGTFPGNAFDAVGDVDGDGLRDTLIANWTGSSSTSVALGVAGGSFDSSSQSSTTWAARLGNVPLTHYEVDVQENGTNCDWLLRTPSGAPDSVRLSVPLASQKGSDDVRPPSSARLIDLNDDGRSDLVISWELGAGFREAATCGLPADEFVAPTASMRGVWLNTDLGWVHDPALSGSLPVFRSTFQEVLPKSAKPSIYFARSPNQLIQEHPSNVSHLYIDDHGVRFAELNGDGRIDLVASRDDAHGRTFARGAWLNTPSGWVPEAAFELPPEVSFVAEHVFRVDAPHEYTASSDTGVRLVDLNGDGLTDIVKTSLPSSFAPQNEGNPSFSASGVWLNTGRGWCSDAAPEECPEAARYRLPSGVSFAVELDQKVYLEEIFLSASGSRDERSAPAIFSSPLVFTDLNRDGLVDLLQLDGFQGEFRAWIHDPSGSPSVWREDTRFQPLTAMELVRAESGKPVPSGNELLDVADDALTDVVSSTTTYRSAMGFSDLLELVDNGRGGNIAWSYTSPIGSQDPNLQGEADQDAAALGEDQGEEAVRWRHQPVVSGITTSGVDVALSTTSFSYAQPRWCPFHQSSLGFRIVTALNQQDQGARRIRFWQQHGRAGRPSRIDTFQGNAILHRIVETWETLDGGLVPGSVPGAHVGRLIQRIAGNYSQGTIPLAGALRDTTIAYDDAYGFNFPQTTTTTRPTGTLVVHRTAVPLPVAEPEDLDTWVAGLVGLETETDGDPANPTTLSETSFLYLPDTRLPTLIRRNVRLRLPGAASQGFADTGFQYDTHGNLVSETDPEGRVREFCYDGDLSFPSGTSCPDPPFPGASTATHSVLVGGLDPLGGIESVEVDLGTGRTIATRRHNGDLDWMVPDAFGRPATLWFRGLSQSSDTMLETIQRFDGISNPAGQSYVERIREIGDGTTVLASTYLDGFGREVRSSFPTPSGRAATKTTRDQRGRPIEVTPPIACGSDPHCDVSLPAGMQTSTTTYDGLGRVLTRGHPGVAATTSVHATVQTADIELVTHPDGGESNIVRDGGRTVSAWTCTSPQPYCGTDNFSSYTYDATGALTSISSSAHPAPILSYTYDTLGRVRTIDDLDGGLAVRTYDRVGNLKTVTNARGDVTTHDYDALNRLTQIDRPPTEPDVSITYDPHTRQRSMTFVGTDVVTGHNYDAFGRQSRKVVVTQGVQLITDFEYDLLGRTTKVTLPDSSALHYGYTGSYLETVCGIDGTCSQDSTTWITDIDYDDVGRPTAFFEFHGVRTFDYDANTSQLTRRGFQESASGEFWLDLTYQYDSSARITHVTDLHNGPGADGISATAEYSYDPNYNRLSSWQHGSGAQAVDRFFRYDALGNLTGMSLASATDPDNQEFGGARPQTIKSRLDTGETFDHDADGNMTRRGSQHLTFNSQNQLTCVGSSPGACDLAAYGYDSEGIRAYEVAGGETRVFVEDFFVWRLSDNLALTHVFANGVHIGEQEREGATLRSGSPPLVVIPLDPLDILWSSVAATSLLLVVLAIRSGAASTVRRRPAIASTALLTCVVVLCPTPSLTGGGGGTVTRRWTYQDHVGSRVLLVSDAPEVIYRRVFEPYGGIAAESIGTEAEPRYLTGNLEAVSTRSAGGSGLVDFGARFYDPEIGRFLSIDPIVQDPGLQIAHNPRAYAGNNPVNFVDLNGALIDGLEHVEPAVADPEAFFEGIPELPEFLTDDAVRDLLFGHSISRPLLDVASVDPFSDLANLVLTGTYLARPNSERVLIPVVGGGVAVLLSLDRNQSIEEQLQAEAQRGSIAAAAATSVLLCSAGGCQAVSAAAGAASTRVGVTALVRTAPAAAAVDRIVRNPAAGLAATNFGQNLVAGFEAGRSLNPYARPVTVGVSSEIGFRAGQLLGAALSLSDAIP